MSENLTEQEIIEAIRQGNAMAFKQVFDACYEDLCGYAFSILRSTHEAEDIVQGIFMKLWEKRTELDVKQTIRSYLFRSVFNQCMNRLEYVGVRTKYARYKQTIGSNDAKLPEVFVDELDERIRQAIEKLPSQCRAVFVMSRYEELRYAEIAERLDISVNTIQNHVCKAIKILKQELKDFI
jgi:RNA polymerase sigma-70 factor, ECF subfamily